MNDLSDHDLRAIVKALVRENAELQADLESEKEKRSKAVSAARDLLVVVHNSIEWSEYLREAFKRWDPRVRAL